MKALGFHVLLERQLSLIYQWMPKSPLKADIFLKKGVGFLQRTGILIGKPLMAHLRKRSDLIDKEDFMVIFTSRTQRSVDILPASVGVFEDDALLLHLAARSRFAESVCPRASGPINADDLAFEVTRLVDSTAWDL